MKGSGPVQLFEVVNKGAGQAVSKQPMGVRRSVVVSPGPEDRLLGRVITLAWIVKTKIHELLEGDFLIFPGKNC